MEKSLVSILLILLSTVMFNSCEDKKTKEDSDVAEEEGKHYNNFSL